MKIICNAKINWDNMEKIATNSKCVIYRDKKYCYKIYNDINEVSEQKYIERICAFEKRKNLLSSAHILPDKLIFNKDQAIGYRTRFLEDSTLLYQYQGFNFTSILYYTSLQLENMHRVGAVFGDFHFGNVLLDKIEFPHLFDFENIQIDDYKGEYTSYNFQVFANAIGIKTDKSLILTEDIDKFSFLLDLLSMTFNKDVLDVNDEDLAYAKSRSHVYKEIDNIIKNIIKNKEIKDIPYFHELVKKRYF